MGVEGGSTGHQRKPDGTIRYRDKQGRLVEKRVDPQVLKNTLNQAFTAGSATRVYRILLKNVLSPTIEEHFMELTDEQVTNFVEQETGTAHAMNVFDNANLRFFLLKKEDWDKLPGYSFPAGLSNDAPGS